MFALLGECSGLTSTLPMALSTKDQRTIKSAKEFYRLLTYGIPGGQAATSIIKTKIAAKIASEGQAQGWARLDGGKSTSPLMGAVRAVAQ